MHVHRMKKMTSSFNELHVNEIEELIVEWFSDDSDFQVTRYDWTNDEYDTKKQQ